MPFEERERKYLVRRSPAEPGVGEPIRQGYLSADGEVAVRVRATGSGDTATHRLTVKGGHGAVRVEVEWTITRDEFDALWPLTAGRRITKRRHRIPLQGDGAHHVAELDEFGEDLDGLVLVEVEFGSEQEMEAFRPPDWFGADVTDDPRYSNAALAISGVPPSPQ